MRGNRGGSEREMQVGGEGGACESGASALITAVLSRR